ncbi:PREDICTED: CISIN_1g0418261mg [Prunus dulcis]|uniref:PREDICTED: CISIN_1g0418261mg n=1 Tax=Prunus dulcis TaxID=3755 RepID=A0A5E4GBZ9_PRUDU|nr:hypothetical protein L3X38_002332 [Prunus dulcis]VVA37142.1 PREDICTED: CISIN_1g0418261mg [Prunus dulcis]
MDGGDDRVGYINGREDRCLLHLLSIVAAVRAQKIPPNNCVPVRSCGRRKAEGVIERMSSRSDLSDSQEKPSSGSAFRDDREDEEVVERMFEAADQMGGDIIDDMFKQRVRLPLLSFLQKWMARLGVVLQQTNPNVYRTMISVQALGRRVHGSELTINQMLHCFLLKRSPHQIGFCYLQSAVGKMIESNPSSQKTWKPHWFYVVGAWKFPEGVEPRRQRIQRRFRMPGRVVVPDPFKSCTPFWRTCSAVPVTLAVAVFVVWALGPCWALDYGSPPQDDLETLNDIRTGADWLDSNLTLSDG